MAKLDELNGVVEAAELASVALEFGFGFVEMENILLGLYLSELNDLNCDPSTRVSDTERHEVGFCSSDDSDELVELVRHGSMRA